MRGTAVGVIAAVVCVAVGALYTAVSRWYERSRRNRRFVERLSKLISQRHLREAMLRCDRRFFVDAPDPYADTPLPIGYNATISAPDALCVGMDVVSEVIGPGSCVLDVGCGSGYTTALFASMVGPTGTVVGIDHIGELVDLASDNIARCDRRLLGVVNLVHGDGREGVPEFAPYDAIYCAAAPPVVPPALVAQLKPGGRLVLPVGPTNSFHMMVQVDMPKSSAQGEKPITKVLGNVRFVPLVDAATQLHGDASLHVPIKCTYHPAPDSTPEAVDQLRATLERQWEEYRASQKQQQSPPPPM